MIQKLYRMISFLKNLMHNRWIISALSKSCNLKYIEFAWPGHFYSPLPDADEIEKRSEQIFDRSIKELPGIDSRDSAQQSMLKKLSSHYAEWSFPEKQNADSVYWADNEYCSYGDGIITFCMLREFKPRQVIEVGSGFSSALMLETARRFMDNDVKLTFIEPYPERLFNLLNEAERIECSILESVVQDVDLSIFSSLQKNDILFIDSTHVAKIGSDVPHLFNTILPGLNKGVIVHIHDILWPFEYPESWVYQGRAWNEAYFLKSFLQYNDTFKILYFNSYMEIHHRALLEEYMPLSLKQASIPGTPTNSSIWLRKIK
ncbi:class I SAM-dependent methyltransferase [bacterium]|nr:class I SAM-dependent methyltransferase [bacterium]